MPKKRKKHSSSSSQHQSPSVQNVIEKRRFESRKEDSVLIKQALAGNQEAFRKLRLKYYDSIFRLISRMIHNKEEVEDLTQESFVKAFLSLSSFKEDFAFSTWLYKIATNNAIDHIRKKKLQTFSIDKSIESEESDYSFELMDTEPEPDQELINAQRKKMLNDAMNSLPPRYRQVILMRHVEEKDYQEIAKILKLPLGTVKAHIFRARELLYKQLRAKMHHY
jgi:RNA polymerase sigma factor (sigma-70 family)